ncbi:hypothetical protein DFQ27_008503 [Actinomortierella ambigua]|uniref:ATP-grasp domain-containing protein n=1 Tax=Actinomortierella ambigua TaxID=1343610 RepID=A0A9P6TYA5_9FUNG|nr:hypothetical protein DFQ27_008503 [Actinomortierella ambigua]
MPSSIDVQSGARWAVHTPYALVKNIYSDRDNLDDGSYYKFELPAGEQAVTEWTPSHRQEVERALESLPQVWAHHWHPIGLESFNQVLDSIVQHSKQDEQEYRHQMDDSHAILETVVLNLVDGMEVDSWPGVSVLRGLESRHLAFTGSDSLLFECDSDKARIKKHLIDTGAPTPRYCDVYSAVVLEEGGDARNYDEEEDRQRVLHELSQLQFPLLVKPANASSSRGISTKSVVDSPEEAYKQAMETKKVWGPVYVEEYISGREFTALVSGSAEYGIDTYKVLERVFRDRVPERERMLTYDMKWGKDNYGSNKTIEQASWWMEVCPDDQQPALQQKAREIYTSFHGNGYCRMDLREDHRTGKLYVVDVNANCSVDEDDDSAMGKILKASGLTLGLFFGKLISFAIRRRNGLYGHPTKSTIEGAHKVVDGVNGVPIISPQMTVHA